MGKQATGKRQHIVPQQMIRNFAGADGKLIEMVKPTFEIATRRRSPKSILFRDDYYRDIVSDFDGELLRPVEQKFAQVYPEVLKGSSLNGRQGAAFVDWVAAMLVRTKLLATFVPSVPKGLSSELAGQLNMGKKILDNLARTEWFQLYQDLFARQGWQWKFRRFPKPCLVLTDHPVCMTSVHQQGGQMVVLPMSSNIVLLGGAPDAIERMRDAIPLDLNFFLIAWADRSIFAADRDILEAARAGVAENSPYTPESVKAARQPLFGAPERVLERMRTAPMPDGFDFGAAIRKHIDSFGPYRWEGEP